MSQAFDKYKNGAYHWEWFNDSDFQWYKECIDKVTSFCQGTTLDVGCGDSVAAIHIARNGYDVFGIDNNELAIDIADSKSKYDPELNLMISRPKTDFLVWDIDKPLGFGQWEYMACLNTIEHLKSPDGLLQTLRDNITKGAVIITDKATGYKGRYHEHEYTKEELLEVFKEFKPKYFEINSTEFGKPITFIGVEIHKVGNETKNEH